jgi:hypothetical protein
MTSAETHVDTAVGAREHLDFVFDASGWKCLGESHWHVCAGGAIGGREVLAVALGNADSPIPPQALNDLARVVGRDGNSSLLFVLTPDEISNEPDQYLAVNHLLAELSLRRKRSPIIAVVLGPLVGPMAMLARLADIICFGPEGSLALADAVTAKRIPSRNEVSPQPGELSCAFASDAAALLGLRRITNLLPAGPRSGSNENASDGGEDLVFERLAGSDTSQHVDERRLLQRIADDRRFIEFKSSGGLRGYLARIGGEPVGVLASTAAMSGALDATALAQAGKLVGFCGRHDMRVITLVDCPGVVPDDAALGGLANLVTAWTDSGVAVISLVVRKAIGAAAAALMPSSAADHVVMHWPDAKVGLLRDAANAPQGRLISGRETRRALVEALASFREAAV